MPSLHTPTGGANQRHHGPIAVTLLVTLALQNAVGPFATDMYTPAFPQVTTDFATTSSLIGLTLTMFFVGFGSGQVIVGSLSDTYGRRVPMLVGGLICIVGSVICALSPNVWVMFLGRFLQGFGGGAAAAVGRALLVDVARGNALARAMSILQAVGGLAPMIAPVVGATILSYAPWRAIFWTLTGFASLMVIAAWLWAIESLPASKRRADSDPRALLTTASKVVRVRPFVMLMMTSAASFFCLFAYVANASYIMQEAMGMSARVFSYVFAANALLSTLGALLNARIVSRFGPQRLITVGLGIASLGVAILTTAVFALGTPVVLTCAGFAVLMGAQSLIYGNAAAMALGTVRRWAGTASALQGLVQALAAAVSAPLATMGESTDARPMVVVMLAGISVAWLAFLFTGPIPTDEAPTAA